MDFEWSPTQRELYDSMRSFGARIVLGRGRAREPRELRELLRECGRAGLLGLCAPECSGGLGLDSTTTARVVEGFAEGCADMGLVFACAAHLHACVMPIAEAGSESLRNALLPRLCDGRAIGANAISEAQAGSDSGALTTRAVRDGREYVIDGEKSWVTNAPLADVFTVYAVTDPAAGYLGISAFAVERDAGGIEVGAPFDKIGLHSALTAPVRFEACRTPASHLLGEEGRGLAVFNRSMNWERSCLFAGYLGLMQRQLQQTLEFAKTRRQFRRPIGSQQAVAHRIVDMALRLESARLLLYLACSRLDRGHDATLAVSMAKLAISEAAVQSGLDAIRVHGGLGVVTDSGVAAGLLDALPCTIFSGTSDMQRNIIARELDL